MRQVVLSLVPYFLPERTTRAFELLLTTDRRIRYPQNLQVRRIALVVLAGTTI